MTCSETEPCPVFLELSAVEAVGNRVFTVGNIHSLTTTLYSVVLASDDAGKSWFEPFERLRGAGLDHVQFVDLENGWISGQLLHPLPQDPFLLVTSDGGKTWRKRPLFSENRYGSIQEFWFSSKTAGSVVLDRGSSGEGSQYELYETPNGGETWMIRQTSDRPIRLRRPAESKAWRIRAESASKSFLLERQTGEKWTAVAAFLVPFSSCKPPETALTPPPPEPQAPEPEKPAAPAPTRKRPPSLKR